MVKKCIGGTRKKEEREREKNKIIKCKATCVNIHSYYSKNVNIHFYTPTNMGSFWANMYKFDLFFLLYIPINVNALRPTIMLFIFTMILNGGHKT